MKFSIITPVYNGDIYISETIESVLSQKGNFEIEYIIMDGGSTDTTLKIIKEYEEKLKNGCWKIKCKNVSFHWFSQKDTGMYDAINNGFAKATGEIYAWINSDDIYLPGAFESIHKTLIKYPEIKWLKGITSVINENSTIHWVGFCYLYNQDWIKKGIYGRSAYFIPQDSVFWKAELWKKIDNIDNNLKLAGDYYLWVQFAKHTALYSLKTYISCFRKSGTMQLSTDMKKYHEEQMQISPIISPEEKKVKKFFNILTPLPISFYPLFYIIYNILFTKQNLKVIEMNRNKKQNKMLGSKSNPILRNSKSFIIR